MPSPTHNASARSWSSEDLDRVQIDCHRSGSDVLWIDMFLVPRDQRQQGLGRAAFERFLTKIPKDVKLLRLFAADTGAGRSHGFWESMGFDFMYDID